jgi:predicted ATPase/transcriptional regulator with XRE-family HTH domain
MTRMVEGENERGFGMLLRQQRLAAGLTQEELAERAGMGRRSIQHLERGEVQPQRVTAHRLAVALALTGEQCAQFEALAGPSPRQRSSGEGSGVVHAPAPDPHGTARHNLPLQLTSFIGRERELVEVTRLLGATRLLTLTGTGGTGKTRVALQVAGGLLDRYPQGVWLADLAALTDPAGVAAVMAAAVGVREEAGQPLLATLVAALRSRHLLLVLDNCEHLLDACATLVQALLRTCPQVTVLATSREGLGLAGEIVWRVPSLALPDGEHLPSPEALAQVEAVRLFVERAQAAYPRFALTALNTPLVAQVCRRLDGIPLALELAAARLRGLSIEHLAARLDQRFRLLTGGSRAALARQQTLQATVDWSYDMLSLPEQTLFNRLAVFSGGFSLEAAEAVCAGGQIPIEQVLNLLLRLVDRSLVVAEDGAGGIERYRLLETLRQYGRERLLTAGEAEHLYVRHLAHYRALAEEAERAPYGPQLVTFIERLDVEQMNIRQALRWALDMGAAQEGMQLAAALDGYWFLRGYLAEGEQWLAALLALPAVARTTARSRALTALAGMRRITRMLDGGRAVGAETQALVAEAVSIARGTGDKWALGLALYQLGGWIAREDYPAGRAMLEECIALCRELDLQWGVSTVTHDLGDVAWEQGDAVAAHAWWSEAMRLARQAGSQHVIATVSCDLGMMAYHQGDYATARNQIAESLALYRTQRMHSHVAITLGCLGAVARAQGDTALARTCYEEKLAFWREIGNRTGIAATLVEIGALALQEGDHTQVQALFEEALSLRRELGDRAGEAAALTHLGDLAYAQGDHERAATLYREGLGLVRASGDRAVTALCLEGLDAVAMAGGQPERAAQLYAAGAAFRKGTFVLNVWDDRVARDRRIAAVQAALGDEAFAAAWAAGQAMTLEQAIACSPTDGVDC